MHFVRTFVSLVEIHVPMMFIDWCLIDALFVLECWEQLYHVMTILSSEAWKELQPKDWTMGRTQIWVIGHSTRDHETPFLRR